MVIVWIICSLIALLLVWGVVFQLPQTKGWAMEKTVAVILSTLPKKDYIVMNNLFFRNGRKTCQIDHLILSPYGIFVVETKNYLGVISCYGNDKMVNRRVLCMRYRTRNPIDQNEWHTRFLIEHFPIIKENQRALIPIVVFNFSSLVRIKKSPCLVCKIQNLNKTIKSYKKFTLSRDLVYEISKVLKLNSRNK